MNFDGHSLPALGDLGITVQSFHHWFHQAFLGSSTFPELPDPSVMGINLSPHDWIDHQADPWIF